MYRRGFALIALVSALWASYAIVGCVGDIAPLQGVPAEGGLEGSTSGKPLGEACGAGGDCASGNCADGVCCDSACTGTCEKCSLPGNAGKCTPVPDGENPDKECPTAPLPDAGAPVDAGDAGIVDAGDAGAVFELPDAAIATDDLQCNGVCNGQRACKFPSGEKTCGSKFCGNSAQQGRAACDGAGHCTLGIEACQQYSCPAGATGCKASCTGEADCLPTHFCDAVSGSCKAKLSNGSGCTSVTQCTTGYCVGNVCCNDACNGFPGASCTEPNKVGTCQCTACATGPCKLYFRDEDGDGFGDKTGTPLPGGNGRAAPGCVAGPAPVGFVADNTDCFDGPPGVATSVHPGQTSFFGAGYGPSTSFDYNCSGLPEKETPEFPGASCHFCSVALAPKVGCSSSTSCSASRLSQPAGLGCSSYFCFPKPCTACNEITTPGFTQNIPCSGTGTVTDCGSCNSTGGISGTTFVFNKQQRCH